MSVSEESKGIVGLAPSVRALGAFMSAPKPPEKFSI